MAIYRKKPIELEAFQWFENGNHPDDDCFRPFEDTGKIPVVAREGAVVRYFRHPNMGETCTWCDKARHVHGWIDTMEGGHIVCPSDWIMTGTEGEHWPVKNKIFHDTYEFVRE